MLVLTRNIGESIIIGQGKEKITVTILKINSTRTQLGVAAPKKISIHRQEVYEKIKEAHT